LDEDGDPLISIITVNYNGKKFLSSLFSSILNLNYPSEKIQIIMVDNGSSDGSVGFVEEKLDLTDLVPDKFANPHDNVLNGIAYDKKKNKIYVTGKRWPVLYEIEIKK
jgi:glutamine cyclotransferase